MAQLNRANGAPRWLVRLCLSFLLFAVAYPAFWLLLRSFATSAWSLTMENWKEASGLPYVGRAFRNTLIIAGLSSPIAVAAGAILALVSARMACGCRFLVRLAALSPLAASQTLTALAWLLLAEPGGGLLNVLLEGGGFPRLNILSLGGMVFLTIILSLPVAFLILEGVLFSYDSHLEEQAFLCGAGRVRTLCRVVFPLALPGIAAAGLLCFLFSSLMFSVQGIIGLPANIWTVTNLLYTAWSLRLADTGATIALASGLLMLGALLALLQRRLLSGRSYYVVTGSGKAAPAWRLGFAGRCCLAAGIGGLLIITTLLPYGALLLRSLAPYSFQVHGGFWEAARGFGLDAYSNVFKDAALLRGLGHSLLLSLLAAGACCLLSFCAGHVVFRGRSGKKTLIEALCMLPLALSGVLIGIGFIYAFSAPLPLNGTLWILLLAYVVRELPFGFSAARVFFAQIHPELEEAALLCGASWGSVARRILWPLAKPLAAAAGALIFLASYRELEASVFLSGPGTEVFGYNVFSYLQIGATREVSAMAVLAAALCLSGVWVWYAALSVRR